MRRPQAGGLGRGGFTFLEIMLVVVIIGILVSLVGPRLVGKTQKAKTAATQHQIDVFKTSLKMFEMQAGRFPATEEGLEALVLKPSALSDEEWDGPYLDGDVVPNDPWNRPYQYVCPGEKNRDFDTWSYGPDGVDGTADDVTNWSTKKEK